ncbi:MAG: NADP-dependent isocitrate dehydrogenase, partial [Pirellulaceae bacterium]
GSHFYLAMYWAQALTSQTQDPTLASRFRAIATELEANEATIVAELEAAQGAPMDLGGYYLPDADLAARAMRPSATFNRILGEF